MADPKDPTLDPGSPHLQPEDYRKLGLGDFSGSQNYTDMAGEPTEEDNRLRREIETKLGGRIQVQVINNVARLTGTVENRFERERLESDIRGMGIATIHNDIHVQPKNETGGPVLTTREPGTNKTGTTQRS